MTSTQDVSRPRSDGVAPPRLSALTGLRFVAVLAVFLYHAHWLPIFPDPSVQAAYAFVVTNGGTIGVSFFFVLSGFVLAWSARPADTPRRFWRRRLVKIFPNHAVVFAGAVVLLLAAGDPVHLGYAVANFFLVHAWTGELSNMLYAVNGVSWSLSVEVVFYLLFPLLIVLVRRIRDEHLWRWAAGVAALAVLMPALAQPFLADQPRFPFYDIAWSEMWFLYFGPPVRVLEFAFGMLLARIVLTGRWIRLPVLPAAVMTVVAYAVSLYLPMIWGFVSLFVVPLGLLIAAVAVRDSAGRGGWLASRPMVWLGEVSYAFFLLHFTLMFALHDLFATPVPGAPYGELGWGPAGGVLFMVTALVASLTLSWLLYVLVERPAMRRWARPRPPRPERATTG